MAKKQPKRRDGRYEIKRFVTDETGRRIRKSFYGRTPEEAKQEADKYRPRTPGEITTLQEFVDHVYAPSVRHRRYKTREQIEWALRLHILPLLGSSRIAEVDLAKCQSLLTQLEPKYKPWTVKNVRKILHAVMQLALDEEYVNRNPVRRATGPPAPKRKEERVLTHDECRRLLEASAGSIVRPVIVLCAFMGLRRGEALALTWGDLADCRLWLNKSLEYQTGQGFAVHKKLKTATSAAVLPLPSKVKELLEQTRNENSIYVCASRTGGPLNPHNVRRSLTAVCRKAGLTRVTLHSLRKSCSSNLAALRVPDYLRQAILRHSSAAMTQDVYTYAQETEMRHALDLLCNGL